MKKLIPLLAIALLSACEPAPAGYTPESFSFTGKPVFRVNVAEIRVVDNYQSPLTPPNMEQTLPVPPATAVHQWAQQRLVAAGTSGVLEVIIDDASMKEVKLPKTEGIKGVFTDDQEARYDASLRVTLRLFTGQQAISDATGDVSVTRSRSINEKATVNQRNQQLHGMTRDMLKVYDEQAESRLRQYFSRFLR